MAAEPASPLNGAAAKDDYFALFGIPRRFGLDRAQLERKFYELSRATHPDRFTTAGPEAQRQALERMSTLNEAYRTLKDPALLRDYYLRLEGLETPADAPRGGAAGPIPTELAESWFELQDALMEEPENAAARIAQFEAELTDLRRRGADDLVALERRIDLAASASGNPPRDLLAELSRQIRAQSYLKSMERDVERIKKRSCPT